MDVRDPLGRPPSAFINSSHKIMHHKIIQVSQNAVDLHGGLIEIYRREVLTQKTRTVRLLGVKCAAKIIQTLLGYEVQAAHKRIHCPDLVTARYLKLFSELGCHSIRLPYDPTVTARLIPIMESALQSILDTVAGIFPKDLKRRQYVIRKVFAIVRDELRNAV
jgi:hypothetical protein